MIEIYGRHTSVNVQKILLFLEELEINFKHIELGGEYGGIDTAEFIKLNPLQRIPVLRDRDKVIWESNTILRYLLLQHPTGSWNAGTPFDRSNYERWMDWTIDRMEPAFVGIFWGYYRTPEESRSMDEINRQVIKCIEQFKVLDNALNSQKFLCGEKISLADISVGVFIYRLIKIDLGIMLPQNVMRWYNRLINLNGYKKWVMSDFSKLAGNSSGY